MSHHTETFVGIDTSKSHNAIAIADGGRGGEVRYLGEFPSTEAAIRKLMAKLAAKYRHLTFCYEAGPTGYGLYRRLESLGYEWSGGGPLAGSEEGRRSSLSRFQNPRELVDYLGLAPSESSTGDKVKRGGIR